MTERTDKPESETGTALTFGAEDKKELSPARRAFLAEQKQRNIVVAKLAELNWGKALNVEVRRAVADWGWRNGVDTTTEVHVLGGNIYLNAQFYINRLVRLQDAGKVLQATPSFIHPDKRLNPTIPAEAEEITRRRMMRIQFNIADEAPAAAMFQLRLAMCPEILFEAAKTAGSYTNPRTNVERKDPIGDGFPAETALTRAVRRACKFAIAQLPELAKELRIDEIEDTAVPVGELLAGAHEQQKIQAGETAKWRETTDRMQVAMANMQDDPYHAGPYGSLPSPPDVTVNTKDRDALNILREHNVGLQPDPYASETTKANARAMDAGGESEPAPRPAGVVIANAPAESLKATRPEGCTCGEAFGARVQNLFCPVHPTPEGDAHRARSPKASGTLVPEVPTIDLMDALKRSLAEGNPGALKSAAESDPRELEDFDDGGSDEKIDHFQSMTAEERKEWEREHGPR